MSFPAFLPRPRLARLTLALALAMPPIAGFAHGSFEERHEKLTVALARDPRNAALRFELAEVYCIEGHADWERALAELNLVEQLAADKHPVDFLRGKILVASNRPADALAAFNRHLRAQPQDAHAYQCRARAWRALNDGAACVADYRTALRLAQRENATLLREAADAFADFGDRDEAADLMAAAVEKFGAIPSLLTRAMELELAIGRFDAALRRAETMQEIWPLPERWHAKRAAILTQAGRLDEARQTWGALLAHLDRLPPMRRESEALQKVAAEARAALASAPLAAASNSFQRQSPIPTPTQ